jgi:uncharacterized protein Smg (DUF494 family)
MRNRILEIVVLLIDYFREHQDHFMNVEDLSTTLKARGYTDSEISSAYSWLLERYDDAPERYFSDIPDFPISSRVLSEAERHVLSPEAHGFLLKLLHLAIIDNEQFETILERAGVVASLPITLEQAKMVASSVIFRDLDGIDRISMFDTGSDPSSIIN